MRTNLHRVLPWLKSPSLLPEVLAELELHGLDAVQAWLTSLPDTRCEYLGRFGNTCLRRGEAEAWLKNKAARQAALLKVGTVSAIAAAVFSLFALFK
jgi:hypothetical protein